MGKDRPLWLEFLLVSVIGFGAVWWLLVGGPIPYHAIKPVTPAEDLKSFDEVQEEIRQNGGRVPVIKPVRKSTARPMKPNGRLKSFGEVQEQLR